jgi:hypothetical protein
MLLVFGARKGLRVQATGCPYGSNVPSRSAWVTAQFDVLVPASVGGAAGAVQGHWVELKLQPKRPSFMGDGDCELVEQMRDSLTKGFTLRGVDYRTSCIPHEISINGYSVKGEVLRM